MNKLIQKAKYGYGDDMTLADFGNYFITFRLESLSPKTFNLYRSALINHFSDDTFTSILLSVSPKQKSKTEKKGSSLRAKGLSKSEMEALRVANNRSKSKYSKLIDAHLDAVPVTGLRPKEWLNAFLDEKFLTVKTIKKKSTYNFEIINEYEFRVIPISTIDQTELSAIQYLISYYNEMTSADWEVHYERFRNAFNRLVLYSGVYSPSSIVSLYTLRHQYAANLKASKVDFGLMSYLLGHSSRRTTKDHYGHMRKGINRFDYGFETATQIKQKCLTSNIEFPADLLNM